MTAFSILASFLIVGVAFDLGHRIGYRNGYRVGHHNGWGRGNEGLGREYNPREERVR